MKVVTILNYESGEVLIHYYDENEIDNNYNGDILEYLCAKDLYNESTCSYMCSEHLIINTVL